jgi:hypothetical protein
LRQEFTLDPQSKQLEGNEAREFISGFASGAGGHRSDWTDAVISEPAARDGNRKV